LHSRHFDFYHLIFSRAENAPKSISRRAPPRPAGQDYSTPPDPLTGLRDPRVWVRKRGRTQRGEKRREKEGRGMKGGKGREWKRGVRNEGSGGREGRRGGGVPYWRIFHFKP